MYTNAEQLQLKKPMNENSDPQYFINSLKQEHQLTFSRFTHELRNPLTLIKSTAQLIEHQHPEVRDYKYWDDLIMDIDDTVTLLNQLSFYNHCDDNLVLEKESLINLISRCVSSFSPMADSNHMEYLLLNEIQGTSDLDHYPCDSTKLKQVFTNLLKNAIEATPKGGSIKTTISLKENLPDYPTHSQYISISIENTGDTMAEDLLLHIFEPFVTTKPEGTGIGLAISKKIIDLHHGIIQVTSQNQTTCFEVLLPRTIALS